MDQAGTNGGGGVIHVTAVSGTSPTLDVKSKQVQIILLLLIILHLVRQQELDLNIKQVQVIRTDMQRVVKLLEVHLLVLQLYLLDREYKGE